MSFLMKDMEATLLIVIKAELRLSGDTSAE